MGNCVEKNPLISRADMERAAIELLEPLIPMLSPGKALLHLGETGAIYAPEIAEMEGFSRALWAIVPMLAGGCKSIEPIWAIWKEGIINGVNPEHPEYWGEVEDFDQRLVEMAVFGMGMSMAPEKFFFSLPKEAQTNLYNWLNQINFHDMPKNNWTFFRVLVNMGFLICGLPVDHERMEKDFAMIEEHYVSRGWYFDYYSQREYYTMWAFHYYGMVYARVMRERDPERAKLYVERGKLCAPMFACWFDKNCEALAYGRSLTYRFAQGAFYAAQAVAEAETDEVDYGVMKHLLLGNLRRWFRKPIFTRDGVLTIGYNYPNLLMAEGYNSPGSPYWALKAFVVLALPEEHPFWQAEEKEFDAPLVSHQPEMRMLITRSLDGSHVMAYEAGNHAAGHSHDEAKYEKFVYSTQFGFSVSKCQKRLLCGAFDSMLALSEDGMTYHPRYQTEEFEVLEDKVISVWHPFVGVTVKTTVTPCGEWHIREHEITTDRVLYAAEGGFAIARGRQGEAETKEVSGAGCEAAVFAPWGISAVKNISGYEEGTVVIPEVNTNLMTPRTLLPTLTAKLEPGVHKLSSMVLGTVTGGRELYNNTPKR